MNERTRNHQNYNYMRHDRKKNFNFKLIIILLILSECKLSSMIEVELSSTCADSMKAMAS